MSIVWFLNVIGLVFSMIGVTHIKNNDYLVFLYIGLVIQTIAAVIYYVVKYNNRKAIK
ncbi:hypothetical protein [Heyndrickxia vini]|uniref:Uncharacterized protein n=1 Tax=Heyndrickxia vini TaxID=1476025 RepID=A0ABX7E2H3_9BACI|nr:hypothetical protein [Heyndrickxia vini]QQZ09918.1 hypothetical protein I5776_02795 [Heyndrickxia vini]